MFLKNQPIPLIHRFNSLFFKKIL